MNAEPSARAKFGKAVKYQQELAEKNPELFEKAQEIMKRITDGDILWMTGIMEALKAGQAMADEEDLGVPPPPPTRRARSRV